MKTTTAYTQPLADGGPSICGSYSRIPGDGLKKTVLRWASDDTKLMKLVRDVAKKDCTSDTYLRDGYCDECDPCIARKLIGRKP